MSTAERAARSAANGAALRLVADHTAVRRVLGNAVALVLAYALPRILTVGAVVLAARLLGAERFGAYGAAGAAAVIMSILSTAGMQPLLVREIARAPRAAPSLLRAAHWIKTGLNVLMLVVLAVFATTALDLRGEALWAALLLSVGYAIGSYAENYAAYFQAVERMHVWTAANAAYGIIAGTAGAALIWLTRSLPWFCVAMVIGQVAAVAWLHRAYRREAAAPVLKSTSLGARALLRAALPFAASFLALTVFYKSDVLLLARLRPATDVGMYAAAYKLVDIAQALALAAIIASYPRLIRAAVGRDSVQRWAATRLAELALLCMAPAAAFAFVYRENLVAALFGDGYSAAVLPAAFLLVALVPLALNLLGSYVLAATDRMKVMAALYGSCAILKLATVAMVAPHWGSTGVAAVMVASELLLAGGFMVLLQRTAQAAPGARTLLAVAGVVCACIAAELTPALLDGALRGIVLLALIAAVYVRLDVIPATERAVLRAALLPARALPIVVK